MVRARILHNPRCSKSRAVLALLTDRGIPVEVVEYLRTPPDAAELDRIARGLGLEPDALVRTGESRFAELAPGDLDRRGWLELLAAHPVLLQRPIVEYRGRMALGRPPERVLPLLDKAS